MRQSASLVLLAHRKLKDSNRSKSTSSNRSNDHSKTATLRLVAECSDHSNKCSSRKVVIRNSTRESRSDAMDPSGSFFIDLEISMAYL